MQILNIFIFFEVFFITNVLSYAVGVGKPARDLADISAVSLTEVESGVSGTNQPEVKTGLIIHVPEDQREPGRTFAIGLGDSLHSQETRFRKSADTIQASNGIIHASNVQVGQIANPPRLARNLDARLFRAATASSRFTYTIQGGDTFYTIAARCNSSPETLQRLNAGVDPRKLQVGQIIHVPSPVNVILTTHKEAASVGGTYVRYSGPASKFPDPSRWALYQDLWIKNSKLMRIHNSAQEVRWIGEAIRRIARESNIDARVILCLIVQESGGNVRVGTTQSWQGVVNTGIMQAHNGVSFNARHPAKSIYQMIKDGTLGTKNGDGLKQCFDHQKKNYYQALREYNSGSGGVNRNDLSDGGGATANYVEKMANRLMGHVWSSM